MRCLLDRSEAPTGTLQVRDGSGLPRAEAKEVGFWMHTESVADADGTWCIKGDSGMIWKCWA